MRNGNGKRWNNGCDGQMDFDVLRRQKLCLYLYFVRYKHPAVCTALVIRQVDYAELRRILLLSSFYDITNSMSIDAIHEDDIIILVTYLTCKVPTRQISDFYL